MIERPLETIVTRCWEEGEEEMRVGENSGKYGGPRLVGKRGEALGKWVRRLRQDVGEEEDRGKMLGGGDGEEVGEANQEDNGHRRKMLGKIGSIW